MAGESPSQSTTPDPAIVPASASAPTPAPGARQLAGRLGELSIPRQVLFLAVWPFLEGLMAWLVGTVDLALAGRLLGDAEKIAALDALGVSAYIGWLLAMLFQSVGVGASALVARAIGARHKRLANSALGQACLLAVLGGIIAGACLYAAAPMVGRLTNLDDRAFEMMVLYLRIFAIGAPFSALLMVGAAALRAAGDTRTPFWVMCLVNAVNIAVSWLLVFGPEPVGGHGVAGIAWGTVVAWFSGALIISFVLVTGKRAVRLRLIRLIPHASTLRRITRVGIPSILESVVANWMANFFVLMIIGLLGQGGYQGVHMIAVRVESLSFMPGVALGIAAATLAGQYLGMGDPIRARKAVAWCWLFGASTMTASGLVFIAVPEWFVRLITDSPLAIEMASPLIRLCGFIQLPFACYLIFAGALRGTGDTRMTLRLTTLSMFLVRLPLVYVAAVILDGGIYGVWIVLCLELSLRGFLFTARFLHGGWLRINV